MSIITLAYASNDTNVNTIENSSSNVRQNGSYEHMSTAQLQEEVEKRSINGNLSFDMGLELLKRWSNK
jgi:hypothetical protein